MLYCYGETKFTENCGLSHSLETALDAIITDTDIERYAEEHLFRLLEEISDLPGVRNGNALGEAALFWKNGNRNVIRRILYDEVLCLIESGVMPVSQKHLAEVTEKTAGELGEIKIKSGKYMDAMVRRASGSFESNHK
jgi:hypothetical protein